MTEVNRPGEPITGHGRAEPMFEHRTEPLLSQRRFIRRMVKFLCLGAVTDALVVLVGAIGFHLAGHLGWLDALLDAAMVVTGNGPRHVISSTPGKLFLTLYALLGGIAYVVVVALILAPALHRLLHIFHLRAPEDT